MLQEYILDWNVKFQRKEYRLSVKQRSTCEYNGNHTGNIKRLLHDIFHIGPGISPRLPYQALTFILQTRSLNWQIAKINP
jgi:hypothetical protein